MSRSRARIMRAKATVRASNAAGDLRLSETIDMAVLASTIAILRVAINRDASCHSWCAALRQPRPAWRESERLWGVAFRLITLGGAIVTVRGAGGEEVANERTSAGLSSAGGVRRRGGGNRDRAADRAVRGGLPAAGRGEAVGLRMRVQRIRRRAHAFRRAFLSGGHPFHHFRSRSGIPVPMDGRVRRGG